MRKTAKLFLNGGSQAVRLPAEFRFTATEVYVRRDALTGEVILSAKSGRDTWSKFFALREQVDVPAAFAEERPLNGSLPSHPLPQER
jgi:antitoxin VapB